MRAEEKVATDTCAEAAPKDRPLLSLPILCSPPFVFCACFQNLAIDSCDQVPRSTAVICGYPLSSALHLDLQGSWRSGHEQNLT